MSSNNEKQSAVDFVERVRANQQKLRSGLKLQYDFIVCGSGSSGSVVASCLAENPDVSVLLLEAGGDDDVPSVTEAARWFENLGTERDWNFVAQPNPHLKGRSIPLNMGKVLGGGSSINVMLWARGHKHDWDFFASESGDPAWNKAARLADYTVEDFDNLFATNVRSPFFLVQQLLPILGDGSNIIVISSIGSHAVVGKPGVDNPSILAYASTKGALETLVKNWAAILGPQGIRVNAVAPGVIDTDMSNFTKTEAGREATLGMQALKRIGKPEDVADVVAFLASDKTRWITGASFSVDGGSKL
jgi:NAD(P)-dependent dehydrogenase (short-subunit alcohol dehydrogenase family)